MIVPQSHSRISIGTWDKLTRWNLVAERNRSAACLFALTRDQRWNEIFLEETDLKGDVVPIYRGNTTGRDAAFTYARLPEGSGDSRIKNNSRRALVADADGSLEYQRNNAFGIASDDPGKLVITCTDICCIHLTLIFSLLFLTSLRFHTVTWSVDFQQEMIQCPIRSLS